MYVCIYSIIGLLSFWFQGWDDSPPPDELHHLHPSFSSFTSAMPASTSQVCPQPQHSSLSPHLNDPPTHPHQHDGPRQRTKSSHHRFDSGSSVGSAGGDKPVDSRPGAVRESVISFPTDSTGSDAAQPSPQQSSPSRVGLVGTHHLTERSADEACTCQPTGNSQSQSLPPSVRSVLTGALWMEAAMMLSIVCDLSGNSIIVYALGKGSVTSVILLSFATLPIIFFASIFFLGKRYKAGHYLAIFLALIGFAFVVMGDLGADSSSVHSGAAVPPSSLSSLSHLLKPYVNADEPHAPLRVTQDESSHEPEPPHSFASLTAPSRSQPTKSRQSSKDDPIGLSHTHQMSPHPNTEVEGNAEFKALSPSPAVATPSTLGWGDMLCLIGAVLLSGSNLLLEYSCNVSGFRLSQVMARYGIYGTPICLIKMLLDPSDRLPIPLMTSSMWTYFIGSVTMLTLVYVLCPVIMGHAGSTFFNISILSCNVFTVVISSLVEGKRLGVAYLVGMGLVMVGAYKFQTCEKSAYAGAALRDQESSSSSRQ
eukprot:GHVN01011923.1.p1 GENE.GHVN01011923.1~~GHVN01011923.1.p1  ORF type:complete len:569 (+),score=77.50 GHVN01011923.1:100-1707(+)